MKIASKILQSNCPNVMRRGEIGILSEYFIKLLCNISKKAFTFLEKFNLKYRIIGLFFTDTFILNVNIF